MVSRTSDLRAQLSTSQRSLRTAGTASLTILDAMHNIHKGLALFSLLLVLAYAALLAIIAICPRPGRKRTIHIICSTCGWHDALGKPPCDHMHRMLTSVSVDVMKR